MRNIKLTISYLGTNYCGWQTQKPAEVRSKKHLPSIQETIEQALSNILQEEIRVTGSGRTDAGVHSLGQTANFQTKTRMKGNNIQKALNSILPRDIIITKVQETDESFHARYSAKSKLYSYTILNQQFPDIFLDNRVYHIPYKLSIQAMRKAGKYLRGRHDFSAFQGRGSKGKQAIRTVKSLKISKNSNSFTIDISADGFLHNMVRRIVGLLVEAGRGKIKPERVGEILESKDRALGGPTAPAKGLCLIHVDY